MKYFLLGAYSSGFFVFGAAMLYGFSGTISFNGIVESMAADAGNNGLLIAATCLLFVGLLIGIILILGGLQFFPALALGPIVEHFAMLAGQTF